VPQHGGTRLGALRQWVHGGLSLATARPLRMAGGGTAAVAAAASARAAAATAAGLSKATFLEHVRAVEQGRNEAVALAQELRAELGASRAELRRTEEDLRQRLQRLESDHAQVTSRADELRTQLALRCTEQARSDGTAQTARTELLASLGLDTRLAGERDLCSAIEGATALRRARDELRESCRSLQERFSSASADRGALEARLKASDREGDRALGEVRSVRRQLEEARQEAHSLRSAEQAVASERDEALLRAAEASRAAHEEVQELRRALEDRAAQISALEAEQVAAVQREEAWRADLAARVHNAFVEGSTSSQGYVRPCIARNDAEGEVVRRTFEWAAGWPSSPAAAASPKNQDSSCSSPLSGSTALRPGSFGWSSPQ